MDLESLDSLDISLTQYCKGRLFSSCPMVAHSPPHINYVLMCEKLINIIVNLDCEQYPIALYVLQNHT